jgi:iron complex outermembrane receptor protein
LKSRFFNGAAELNLAGFWTEDSNYQANFVNTTVTPAVQYITNVGKLRSRGVEFDARLSPLTGLNFSLAGAYIDAQYSQYRSASAPYLISYVGVVDLSGQQASGQPKWSLTGAAEYKQPVAGVELYAGGDVSYRSSFYAAVNLDPFSKVDAYTLVGLHAGVRQPNGRWDLSFWVRNLFDQNYYNTKSVSSTYGVVLAALGDPRLFGVTLRSRL